MAPRLAVLALLAALLAPAVARADPGLFSRVSPTAALEAPAATDPGTTTGVAARRARARELARATPSLVASYAAAEATPLLAAFVTAPTAAAPAAAALVAPSPGPLVRPILVRTASGSVPGIAFKWGF